MTEAVPKVIVFDLDGTLWNPEMYQLSGGSPFSYPNHTNNKNKNNKNNNNNNNNNNTEEKDLLTDALIDKRGTAVQLIGETRAVLTELINNPLYAKTYLAVSSTCDEPHWAQELLNKFHLVKKIENHNNNNNGGVEEKLIPMNSIFSDLKEVYYASKADQHRTILKKIQKKGDPLGAGLLPSNNNNNNKDEKNNKDNIFSSFLFFDNQHNNIATVSKLGVTCCYCGSGMTEGTFARGIEQWRRDQRHQHM